MDLWFKKRGTVRFVSVNFEDSSGQFAPLSFES